jgi:hypothetical protein
VGESATVQCADAEVGDALVIGLFQGTLRARGVVRIHQSGRVMGDILATRVVFVSEPPPSTRTPPAVTALPPAAPAVSPPAPAPPAAALATIAPPPATSLAMPHAEPPHALPSPSTPQVAEPARSRTKASTPPPRVIPTLPSIGQRAMERKD